MNKEKTDRSQLAPPVPPTIKLKLLRRANYICEKCKCYSPKLTFHHLIPQRLMGEMIRQDKINKPENLKVLCIRCHNKEHHDETHFTWDEIQWIVKKLQNGKYETDQETKDSAIRKLLMIRHIVKKRGTREPLVDDLGDNNESNGMETTI